MKTKLVILLAACVANLPALAIQAPQSRAPVVAPAEPGAAVLSERVATLRRTSAELRTAARQPIPTRLSAEQTTQVKDYDAWLRQESRGYTAISNIMKTKHDTVKHSISNVR